MKLKYLLLVLVFNQQAVAHSEHEHIYSSKKENITETAQQTAQPTARQTTLETELKQQLEKAKQTRDESIYKHIIKKTSDVNKLTAKSLLYRADAQQYLHQFDNALESLKLAGNLPGAQLMKANIYMIQGRYNIAAETCKSLLGKIEQLDAVTCFTHAISLNGKLEKAYKILHTLVENTKDEHQIQAWSYAVLADMAERLGKQEQAESYYKKAVKLSPDDASNRIALLDILLKQKRYDEVAALAKDHLSTDAVLLRYVRALNIQGDLTMNGYFCELKRRVLRYSRKSVHVHFDTQSEYELYFTPDLDNAMKSAKSHWKQQKMPRDTRLYATLAQLTGNLDAIDSIRHWQQQNNVQDSQLTKLIE